MWSGGDFVGCERTGHPSTPATCRQWSVPPILEGSPHLGGLLRTQNFRRTLSRGLLGILSEQDFFNSGPVQLRRGLHFARIGECSDLRGPLGCKAAAPLRHSIIWPANFVESCPSFTSCAGALVKAANTRLASRLRTHRHSNGVRFDVGSASQIKSLELNGVPAWRNHFVKSAYVKHVRKRIA